MTFLYPNVQINHRVIFFLLMLMAAPALGAAQEIRLYSSGDGVSHAGHIKLEWQPAAAARLFEVQQAADESFGEVKTIYNGPDRATFVSGLKNGTYYFRVRGQGQDWSNVQKLEVIHHSLTLTYVLLGLGGLVFLSTAGMVLYGVRKSAQIQ